jgi:hypothetical protein
MVGFNPRFFVRFLMVSALVAEPHPAGVAHAASPDDSLNGVHGVLRITGPHVEWARNASGGVTPTLVFDITNVTNVTVPIPVTVHGGRTGYWVGAYRVMIERLGFDSTIPALPQGTARRGRQYEYNGGAIDWPTPQRNTPQGWIAPGNFCRFGQPIAIGGFPSGVYELTIEYFTGKGDVIDRQARQFALP